jgi:glycerate 2-kinase
VDAAIRAADPRLLLLRALDAHPFADQDVFNVVAAGKAARPMADAFMERFAARTRQIVVARGGHPLPNAESVESGEAALRLADANRARGEMLVVLLSGGASAMLAAPAPGVTLEEMIGRTRELLRSGRPIAEINAVRKQMSAIKGGKLALRAGRCVTFAISDVHAPIEDDPSVIGSGPAVVADPVPEGVDARFVLAGSRRDAMNGARAEGERLGYRVARIEPPTLGEARDAAGQFVASASAFLDSASTPAASAPAPSTSDPAPSTSDPAPSAPVRSGPAASVPVRPDPVASAPGPGPVASALRRKALCVIASGETTVALSAGSTGRGGRNQEFALAAARHLHDIGGHVVLASVGSDGIDGPTDAAGAVADETTIDRARAMGLDPDAALEAHDSYRFFQRLGDLIVTGPTGTNVGDIQILLLEAAD